MHAERRFDYDPPALRSPRVFSQIGDVDGLGCATAFAERPRSRLTDSQRNRLAKDLVIYHAIKAGMSQEMVGRGLGLCQQQISKSYRRMVCRNSRV